MSYSLRVVLTVDEVEQVFWNLNRRNFAHLYRTPEYLRDSQTRLGDQSIYVEVFRHSTPVALIPVVLFHEVSSYPPFNPHQMVREALSSDWIHGTVAASAVLFAWPCPVLVNTSDIEWPTVMDLLRSTLRDNFGVRYIVFAFMSSLDDPFSGSTFEPDLPVQVMPHKLYGVLDLESYGSLDGYRASLSRNARRSFVVEERNLRRWGVKIEQQPVSAYHSLEIGVLGANVFEKYGTKVDPRVLESFAKHLDATYGHDAGLFTAVKDSDLLSFSLYVVHDGVLHLKMLGRNYELDRYGTYFSVGYHAPIQFGFCQGLRFVDYGPGAPGPKQRRGIDMVQTYAYIFS